MDNIKTVLGNIENTPNGLLKRVDLSSIINEANGTVDGVNEHPVDFTTPNSDGANAQRNNIPNSFDENFTPNQPNNLPPRNGVNFGNLLNAETVVELTDMLIPALISVVLSFFQIDISSKELQASAKQKDALKTPTEMLLMQYGIKSSSPLAVWLISIASVYGSNGLEKGLKKKFGTNDKNKSEVRIQNPAQNVQTEMGFTNKTENRGRPKGVKNKPKPETLTVL